jgi:hypothetical protein
MHCHTHTTHTRAHHAAFIVNIDDFPICRAKRCPLPVFTNYKKWRGGRNLDTNELLFPVRRGADAVQTRARARARHRCCACT